MMMMMNYGNAAVILLTSQDTQNTNITTFFCGFYTYCLADKEEYANTI